MRIRYIPEGKKKEHVIRVLPIISTKSWKEDGLKNEPSEEEKMKENDTRKIGIGLNIWSIHAELEN